MLRKIDRVLLRVSNLASAVKYYREVLGLTVVRQDARIATFKLDDGRAEMVLHTDPDLPAEAVYYLVDDVRAMFAQREALKLKFVAGPVAVSRGYTATVKDPFGNILMILDRTAGDVAGNEDSLTNAGALFAGVEQRSVPRRELLIKLYQKVGRTADDLPYTPHFESLYSGYLAAGGASPEPTRAEVWRHLLNLRKAGKLPKLGEARSAPPQIDAPQRKLLRELLGDSIGRRDRLPYTELFDGMIREFNRQQDRKLSPHLIWRLVATLAK